MGYNLRQLEILQMLFDAQTNMLKNDIDSKIFDLVYPCNNFLHNVSTYVINIYLIKKIIPLV